MSGKRWVSVNEFMESISELLNDAVAINVYFDDWRESKYNWSVKVIGFSIIDKAMKAKAIRYYDVHKLIPEMEYIQFKANKDRNMKEINKDYQKKLCKLIIHTEKTPYKDNHYYHRSLIKVVENEKLYRKLLKEMSEDKVKFTNELAENANIKTEEDLDLDIDEEI